MLNQALPKIQAELERLPDEALQPLLGGTNPDVPPFLVMAELERRKQMRGTPQQQTPPGTMVSGLADPAGIARFAEGGYVGSEMGYQGEYTEDPEAGPFFGRLFSPGSWGFKKPDDRATRVGTEKGRKSNPGSAVTMGAKAPAIAVQPGVQTQPGYSPGLGGMPMGGAEEIEPTKVRSLDEYMKELGNAPEEKPITDADRDGAADRLRGKYGYDFQQEKDAQAERRAGLADMKKQGGNEALMKLGLGMMASKQRRFLGAVGEAGGPALDYYARAQAAAREEQRAIAAGDLAIARAANAEKLQLLQLASGQLKDNQQVDARNQGYKSGLRRDGLTLRNQDVGQRRADIAANVSERNANRRAGIAALAAAGRQRQDIKIPAHLTKAYDRALERSQTSLQAQLDTLMQMETKGKTMTPQQRQMLAQLRAPGAIDKLAVAAARQAVPNLPTGPYDARGGIGGAGEEEDDAVDLTN